MARLVPNPIGDIRQPLERVEGAIANLSEEISDVRSLPAIQGELVELNRTMAAVLDALHGLRKDLAEPSSFPAGNGREPGPAKGRGRARPAS